MEDDVNYYKNEPNIIRYSCISIYIYYIWILIIFLWMIFMCRYLKYEYYVTLYIWVCSTVRAKPLSPTQHVGLSFVWIGFRVGLNQNM